MSFSLSEQHLAKKATYERFAATELDNETAFPWENLNRAAASNLLSLPIAQEWGGAGEDFLSYILLIEAVSAVCPSTGVIMAVHTSVGTMPLFLFGRQQLKQRYLENLSRGRLLGAFALTEAGAGSDPSAIKTKAVKVKGGYLLNGEKIFITGGNEAQLYTVFAATGAAGQKNRLSVFLIPKKSPGLGFSAPEKKMGLKRSYTTTLYLNDLYISEENLLGREGDGFKIAMALLDGGRIGIAAQGLGIAGAVLKHFKAGLKKIDQKVLNARQGALFALADLETDLEAAKLLTYYAAAKKERGEVVSKEASMAKVFATDLAMKAATTAIDYLGPEAARDDGPLASLFRDAKVTQIYEGTNQIQRIVIARELMKIKSCAGS